MKLVCKATFLMVLPILLAMFLPMRPAEARLPQPDLTISNVVEVGTTARVNVRNIGMLGAGPCVLRVYQFTLAGWSAVAQVNVPGIPAGGNVWVSVTHPAIALAPTLYAVDATNVIAESNEGNNRVMVP